MFIMKRLIRASNSSGNYGCEKERREYCVRWVEKYFKDCLCNVKDELSFGFGMASLVCWGIAEVPQIVTNFKNKSGHGVSLAFLSTWIIGDIFNMVGCVLEPATLPTQYYTALLYTTSTVILVLQCLYYDYLLPWWKKFCHARPNDPVRDETKPLTSKTEKSITALLNSPIEVPHRKNFYYMSARSMAGSDTPPFQCYMKAKSGPSALEHDSDYDASSEDEAISGNTKRQASQPRSIPCPAAAAGYYGTFLAGSLTLPRSKALASATFSGRRLLQEQAEFDHSAFGQWLGWLMAAIYMGGRLPQIWLNGLNPLMFIFALIANATYVASILVRSTEWEKIKANMPWLLDAIVCVLLDFFIILQYVYYKYITKNKSRGSREYYDNYPEASKVLLS